MGEGQPQNAEGDVRPKEHAFAWYLRQRHQLIRRHAEVLTLHPDHTVRWELRIDLELPTDKEALWKPDVGEQFYPFPLLFLKKAEGRREFSASNEAGETVQIPIRQECDKMSTEGLLHAAISLLAEMKPALPSLPRKDLDELEDSFHRIVVEKPFQSAMLLAKLRERVGLIEAEPGRSAAKGKGQADPEEAEARGRLARIGRSWEEGGLDEVLQMLVEHSLIWVPLKGRPGQRRSIVVSERKELQPRPFVRWAFGELRDVWWRPRQSRRMDEALSEIATAEAKKKIPDPKGALAIGGKAYGRRKRTVSFSALGERIGRPLAWMPFEFEVPTIYAMRCASYHFEVRCPPGRTPRDLRIAAGPALAEPGEREEIKETPLPSGTRRTLTSSIARVDVPPHAKDPRLLGKDLWFRLTIGIGDGAFPILWFLAAAITAVMLWVLADANPSFEGHNGGTNAQILAGILLVVPALVSALAVGSNEVPITQLIGGARILLLITGLSAVGAAAVVAGASPWGISAESTWALCAVAATAATVPLGTSWLLSRPAVWRGLKQLDSRDKQRVALRVATLLALIAVGGLIAFCDEEDLLARGVISVYMLALAVTASVVGNDRAAMKVNVSRHYVAVSFLIVGFLCLALACIELRGAIGEPTDLQETAEWLALALLPVSLFSGEMLYRGTGLKPFRPRDDEVHVSPRVGQAMLEKERVRELTTLREREDRVARAGNSSRGANITKAEGC